MIKQLVSKNIKKYLETGATKILLDVRTKGEWDTVGKPDGGKIGLKTYFLEIRRDALFGFVKEFKDFNIDQKNEILVICKSGERSQITAELLSKENYKAINISDGFEGSTEGVGWINSGLPIKF
jgi:rhodanese-related sulfurtransferase